MLTWHTEEVVRVSRERCGGASFLSINQICEGLTGAHSGMTAEGDNKVLM